MKTQIFKIETDDGVTEREVCMAIGSGRLARVTEVNSEDKTPEPKQSEPFKVETLFCGPKLDDRQTTLSGGTQFPNYIGWEDDRGNLHGKFRRKDGGKTVTWGNITIEQWESGEWEAVKPVKLWFKGGGGEWASAD